MLFRSFVVGIMLWTSATQGLTGQNAVLLVAAAMIGGYMAMNIGANDVANNVGPAVGAKAISMVGAIMIAAVFEAAGALIAGGDVVATIQKGVIRADAIAGTDRFVWLMTAALLAAALWLNIATAVGAPVSTTHILTSGVAGASVANGAGLRARTIRNMVLAWVLTLPAAMLIAGTLYWALLTIVRAMGTV